MIFRSAEISDICQLVKLRQAQIQEEGQPADTDIE